MRQDMEAKYLLEFRKLNRLPLSMLRALIAAFGVYYQGKDKRKLAKELAVLSVELKLKKKEVESEDERVTR